MRSISCAVHSPFGQIYSAFLVYRINSSFASSPRDFICRWGHDLHYRPGRHVISTTHAPMTYASRHRPDDVCRFLGPATTRELVPRVSVCPVFTAVCVCVSAGWQTDRQKLLFQTETELRLSFGVRSQRGGGAAAGSQMLSLIISTLERIGSCSVRAIAAGPLKMMMVVQRPSIGTMIWANSPDVDVTQPDSNVRTSVTWWRWTTTEARRDETTVAGRDQIFVSNQIEKNRWPRLKPGSQMLTALATLKREM